MASRSDGSKGKGGTIAGLKERSYAMGFHFIDLVALVWFNLESVMLPIPNRYWAYFDFHSTKYKLT